MNKGFILTISALYYVALFILFLSLLVFMSFRITHFGSVPLENQFNNYRFITGEDSIPIPSPEYWCSSYIANYDANIDLESQTPMAYKNYCVIYDGKRII